MARRKQVRELRITCKKIINKKRFKQLTLSFLICEMGIVDCISQVVVS